MNNNINNISFQANLITKIKGRDNIMSKIASEFQFKTRNMPGTMELVRGGNQYPGAMILKLKKEPSPIYSIINYKSFLSQTNEKVTSKDINKIAKRFSKIFKMLTLEDIFTRKIDAINLNLNQVHKALRKNSGILAAVKNNGNEKYIKPYEVLVKNNTNRIKTLNTEKELLKKQYIDNIEKIAGEDKEFQEYVRIQRDFL